MHLRQGLDARGERVLGDGPWAVVRDRGAPDRHCESRYVTPFLKWSHVAATKCGLYDIAILFTQMAQIARIRPSQATRKCPYPFWCGIVIGVMASLPSFLPQQLNFSLPCWR
jgi:hypothetical protein